MRNRHLIVIVLIGVATWVLALRGIMCLVSH